MIQIISEGYENIAPQQPSKRALAVFNMKDAGIAFNYGGCDFVVALDENTMKFAYCFSLRECEEFWELNGQEKLLAPAVVISRFLENIAEENQLDIQDVVIWYDKRSGVLEVNERRQTTKVLGTINVKDL
jgi:hypothetical protein